MNRICIIIFAHKNEKQLSMLINRLKTDFDVYLHIDKKSNINIVSDSSNVKVYKKFNVVHGGLSQVTTTLFMLSEARKNNYERYITISGQDLPIKSNEYIINFFDNNKDKEFITYTDVRSDSGLCANISARINNYNFGTFYRRIVHIKMRTLISKLPHLKRELPANIYFGDSWFNITGNAVNYILDYVENNKSFLSRMKYTWGCDEVFFQSILLTSPLRDKCENCIYRYLVWGKGTPIILTLKDYDRVIKSKGLFARKFDDNVDSEVINKIYSYLEKE